MALNVGKTNFVIFRSPQKKSNRNVTLIMNKKALQQKDHVKYLGVLIDEHLNWKYQINQVALKISRGIGILAKLKPYLKEKLLRTIYFSLVYSYLSYGVQAWGSAADSIKNKIVVLQNKAIRIMSGVQYFQIYGQVPGPLPSSEPLYRKLEILKFEDIFKLNVANFVYSTLDFESPSIFHDWFCFQHETHNHSTRMSTEVIRQEYFDIGVVNPSLMLHTRRSNNNYGDKTMKALGPSIWNSIPDQVLKSASYNSFKTSLKKHLIGQYGNDNSSNSNSRSNGINNNRNRYRDNRRTRLNNRNNNYGVLTDENRQGRFQSRWDDGPNNLI